MGAVHFQCYRQDQRPAPRWKPSASTSCPAPADDAFTFVPGKFVRLDTPDNTNPGDDHSPLLVGHVVVGSALAALFTGTVVQLRNFSELWRVLTIAALTAGMISTNRSAPTRRESAITGVTTQL